MLTLTRNWIFAGLVGLLVACGGGGGGDSAPGVQPGPPPPGQPIPPEPIPPTPSANPYVEAQVLNAFITDATLNDDNQPVIEFQLSDGNNIAITDLTLDDVRFVVSKLAIKPAGQPHRHLAVLYQCNRAARCGPGHCTGAAGHLRAQRRHSPTLVTASTATATPPA